MKIIRAEGLTPRWTIYRANEPGFARWTYAYVYGSTESPEFPDDDTMNDGDVNVKMFNLAPHALQPPHMHEEDIIFAVVSGRATFLSGVDGHVLGTAGPRDVVFVGKGEYYGSKNNGPEIFSAYIVRLPRTAPYSAPYNVYFPKSPPQGEDPIQIPGKQRSGDDGSNNPG